MAAILGLLLVAAAQAGDPGREESVRRLSSLKVSVDFQDTKLEEAIGYLRDVTGLNILLQPTVQARVGELKVRLKARDLAAKSVLRLLLSGHGLSATYQDGAVLILPTDELHDQMTLRMYDVRSLTGKMQDFPGPRMELTAPGSKGGTPLGAGVIIELANEPREPLPPDFLVELVRSNTGGSSWDKAGAEIRNASGMLVVSQTPQTHREIERLLGLVGQFR
jgi:hypothetical protein